MWFEGIDDILNAGRERRAAARLPAARRHQTDRRMNPFARRCGMSTDGAPDWCSPPRAALSDG